MHVCMRDHVQELQLLEARSRIFGLKRLSPSLMKLLPVAKDASIAEIQVRPRPRQLQSYPQLPKP